jgi:uncharacterized damage-inducible protein DinB
MNRDAAPISGYPPPYDLLLAILQDGTSEWREEVWDEVGPDAVTWRATPGGPSIGAIVLHMIAVEVGWLEEFVLQQPRDPLIWQELLIEETDVDEGRWPDPPRKNLQWYYDLQDRYRLRTLEVVKRYPSADTLIGQERKRTPRWVLGHVIQHEAYHGGQVVMLYDLWKKRDQVHPQTG